MAIGITASIPSITGSMEADARMDRVIVSLKPVRATMVSGCKIAGAAKKVTASVSATSNGIARMAGSIKGPLVSMLSGASVSASIKKISGSLVSNTRYPSQLTWSIPSIRVIMGSSESVHARIDATLSRFTVTAVSSNAHGHRIGAVVQAAEATLSATTGRRGVVSVRLPRFKAKLLASTAGSTGVSVVAGIPQGVDVHVSITATTEHAPLKHEREEVR